VHEFLNSALERGEWSASRPGRFILGEGAFGTYWIRVRVSESRSGRGGKEYSCCCCWSSLIFDGCWYPCFSNTKLFSGQVTKPTLHFVTVKQY